MTASFGKNSNGRLLRAAAHAIVASREAYHQRSSHRRKFCPALHQRRRKAALIRLVLNQDRETLVDGGSKFRFEPSRDNSRLVGKRETYNSFR